MKIDPYYKQPKCRPMILVSGNIRYGAGLENGSENNLDFLGF